MLFRFIAMLAGLVILLLVFSPPKRTGFMKYEDLNKTEQTRRQRIYSVAWATLMIIGSFMDAYFFEITSWLIAIAHGVGFTLWLFILHVAINNEKLMDFVLKHSNKLILGGAAAFCAALIAYQQFVIT